MLAHVLVQNVNCLLERDSFQVGRGEEDEEEREGGGRWKERKWDVFHARVPCDSLAVSLQLFIIPRQELSIERAGSIDSQCCNDMARIVRMKQLLVRVRVHKVGMVLRCHIGLT